jgi:hypothetical protein
VKQWQGLSARERRIFCVACLLLPMISLSLKWAGLRATTRWLSRMRSPAAQVPAGAQADVARSAARLVTAAARRHPVKTVCLAQSVTLWFLLLREGVDSAVRIGVNRADGVFSAHAWIEVDGQVFLDGPDVVNHFTVIV